MHFSRHFPFRGQLAGFDSAVVRWCGVAEDGFAFSSVLLCLEIRFTLLGMQLKLNFTLLLLQSCAIDEWGKFLVKTLLLLPTEFPTNGSANMFTIWWIELYNFSFLIVPLFGWVLILYFSCSCAHSCIWVLHTLGRLS